MRIVAHVALNTIVALSGLACLAQSRIETTDQKVIADLEQRMSAMKEGISREFADKYIENDCIWESPMGASGKAVLVKPFEGQTILERRIEDMTIRVMGDAAVASGRWWKKARLDRHGKVHDGMDFFRIYSSERPELGSW